MILEFGKHKVLELWGPKFWKVRGRLNVLSFDISIGWKGDHDPSVFIHLAILNAQIFEIHWYDTRHEDTRS